MIIRNATTEDFPRLLEIYAYAREFMKRTGNPNQWFDYRPEPEVIAKDIELQRNYVFEEDGVVHAVFALAIGDEPTYRAIEGAWLNDEPYGTIHRIASDGVLKNVFHECIAFSEKMIPNLRVDTHEDNKVMQSVVAREGFEFCGIIYVENGTPRNAYQRP